MGSIHPVVSEICVPQSLDPICAKFDKFLAHGQAHMRQMGKWPWQCTTTGLDNSTALWTEKIHQAVTEIWVPQVWQPPARPPARPPVPWRQYPSSPEGWGVKIGIRFHGNQTFLTKTLRQNSSISLEECFHVWWKYKQMFSMTIPIDSSLIAVSTTKHTQTMAYKNTHTQIINILSTCSSTFT